MKRKNKEYIKVLREEVEYTYHKLDEYFDTIQGLRDQLDSANDTIHSLHDELKDERKAFDEFKHEDDLYQDGWDDDNNNPGMTD